MENNKTNKKGYNRLLGNHVVLVTYAKGKIKKDIDRIIKNKSKGIVSFSLI